MDYISWAIHCEKGMTTDKSNTLTAVDAKGYSLFVRVLKLFPHSSRTWKNIIIQYSVYNQKHSIWMRFVLDKQRWTNSWITGWALCEDSWWAKSVGTCTVSGSGLSLRVFLLYHDSIKCCHDTVSEKNRFFISFPRSGP